MHHPIRVLFLCEGNADRSQMAEGLLRARGDQRFEVHSAGLDPRPLDPLAITAMQEVGIDISQQTSKHLNDYEDMQFDYVVTLCEQVVGSCLDFARDGHTLHWYCSDPLEATGSDTERLTVFRRAREEIDSQLDTWLLAFSQ